MNLESSTGGVHPRSSKARQLGKPRHSLPGSPGGVRRPSLTPPEHQTVRAPRVRRRHPPLKVAHSDGWETTSAHSCNARTWSHATASCGASARGPPTCSHSVSILNTFRWQLGRGVTVSQRGRLTQETHTPAPLAVGNKLCLLTHSPTPLMVRGTVPLAAESRGRAQNHLAGRGKETSGSPGRTTRPVPSTEPVAPRLSCHCAPHHLERLETKSDHNQTVTASTENTFYYTGIVYTAIAWGT